MRKLLARIFIKDYQEYSNPKVRSAYGTLSGIVGIVTNIFLCVIKIVTGFFAGSISIIADGINNLSDAGSSIITLIGFKISSMPADDEHPFGHERMEYITGLIVSFIIILIGVSLFKSSIDKIINPEDIDLGIYTFIVLGISVLVKIWQWSFYRTNGKLINSTALIATSSDSINDAISTGAVLLAMIISKIFTINLDSYMGLVVSLFIIISGVKLVKETISPLIGEAPSKEFVKEVVDKIKAHEGVLGIHDLVFHSYGPLKTFITAHVEVDSQVDVLVSHDMIDNIEQEFRDEKINLVIHMDPIDTTDQETVELRKKIGEIVHSIDENLNYHDFRMVKGFTHTNLIFDVVVPNKFKLTNEQLLNEIVVRVKEIDEKYNVVITFDNNYIG